MPKSKKRRPGKPQGMNLAQTRAWEKQQFDALVEARARELFAIWSHSLIQQTRDSDYVAAAELLGLGPETCMEFGDTAKRYQHEIALLIHEDYQDDPDTVYAREKIDQRLREICGEHFEPWEVRYGSKTGSDGKS